MPEQHTSISDARKNLPKLSQGAKVRMDRFIITHQGQPQSVLLGYKEYQGMKAAMELLHRPEIVEDIFAGLKDFESGEQRMSADGVRKQLRASVSTSKFSTLVTEVGRESGIDAHVVATVINALVRKVEVSEDESAAHAIRRVSPKGRGKLPNKTLDATEK